MKNALTLILLCLPYAATQSQPALPAAVEPLLTSTWGQRAPYNFMCPLKTPTPWGGYQPDEQHCRVGCVAVAMGQIMRYHQWPAQGEGSNSVVYPVFDTSANTFSVDFAEAVYDWENMIDDYSGDYTEAEGRAVAELLYHCAVASNMLFEKTFSFSTNFTAGDALVKYFHYDGSRMQTRMRSDYSRSEWLQMIREELSSGRPVFYEAISLTEGIYAHSFVIDGYNADGLVHVNWGWYGHEDGYYDIDLLDPPGYQFNFYQDMIVGIQPAQSTSIDQHPSPTPQHPSPNIYTPDGRLVRADASSLDGLPRGLYIWKGKKVIIR